MDIIEKIILKVGISALKEIHRDIKVQLRYDKKTALKKLEIRWKEKENITRIIDFTSEQRVKTFLYRRLNSKKHAVFENFVIIGEESLDDPNIHFEDFLGIVCLVDMVDGTELLVRNLYNWCSAMVFFRPVELKILASIICDATGNIYFATDSEKGAYVIYSNESKPRKINPSNIELLKDASICCYGQKAPNLSRITSQIEILNNIDRFYNLAGNPMIVRVAEGLMDGVIELTGQCAHDVIPGAYIAKKAGAVVKDISGNELNLIEPLIHPAEKQLRYIITPTDPLNNQLFEKLKNSDISLM